MATNTIIDGTGLTLGTPGYTLSTSATPWTGANVTWTSPATWTTSDNFTISNGSTVSPSGTIALKGDNADIDINGKSMKDWMEKVEERLNLLSPNPELESEWEELKQLGEQYRALEKHINEKMKTWKKISATDGDNC